MDSEVTIEPEMRQSETVAPWLHIEVAEIVLRGKVMQCASSLQYTPNTTEAGVLVELITHESRQYVDRLSRAQNQLAERAAKERDQMDQELRDLTTTFASTRAAIDAQITEFSSRAPARKPESASTMRRNTSISPGTADDAARVVQYWKAKHALVHQAVALLEEEKRNLRDQVQDLKDLRDPTQFLALQMMGELRAQADELHERLNGARLLHLEMQASQNAMKSTRDSTDRSSRDGFSVIDRKIVELEENCLKGMQIAVDARTRSLKHLYHQVTRRVEALERRIDDIKARTAAAPSMSLDRTLEHALDLRGKALALKDKPAEQESFCEIIQRNSAKEAELRQTTNDIAHQASADDLSMKNAIRERRVNVIRTIHNSGGSVDARFEILRAQQHVSAISHQVAAAEHDRLSLKLQLANAVGQVFQNAELLARVDP